ncbi:neuronal-specific septin-3-like isoform X2 [Lathamus discolor]|uniref:neuronal-specific septin-3-like isoform X2 n=1 Tax=Lathamus discolor TaxID=678569 RepID=UPI0032B7B49A
MVMARWLSMAYRAGHEPSSSVWAPSALQMARGWQALLGHGSFSARKRCGCTASSVGNRAAPSQCHPWCPCGTSVPRPTGGRTERATTFHFHTERAWVTHAGLGARRRRSRGGAVGCSHPPRLHPRSHLASVTRSWWQQPRLRPARPGSSLEPEERSMEPPAEPEEEVPITTAPGPAGCQLFGYVGIEAVLDQMKIKTMKTGFEFNIMVVGQSGLGKSTMVNTLFKSKVSRKASQPGQEERIPKTVQLQSITHVIEEKGVKMKLTVTDTPGFGDQINNENCWDPIIKYINEQYERYLREEILITRKRKIPDTRVHGCVYFIPPTGHWLRPLDLEFMRRLSKIVNVVPVIAKADTLTLEERAEFKQQIQEDLKTHAISVYPQEDFDQDPDDRVLNDRIRENIPFAVVGADQEHQVNGKRVLGRKTKWGIIEVENPTHCEFPLLRDLLIRSHLQDLKDITHNVHYESYRVRRLNESNRPALSPPNGLAGKGEAGSDL